MPLLKKFSQIELVGTLLVLKHFFEKWGMLSCGNLKVFRTILFIPTNFHFTLFVCLSLGLSISQEPGCPSS